MSASSSKIVNLIENISELFTTIQNEKEKLSIIFFPFSGDKSTNSTVPKASNSLVIFQRCLINNCCYFISRIVLQKGHTLSASEIQNVLEKASRKYFLKEDFKMFSCE